MPAAPSSRARAALLAAVINLRAIEPLDLLRYLRVPAIHFVLRRERRHTGRVCTAARHGRRRLAGFRSAR